MAFEEQLPQWENEGTQPPQSKRAEGWLPNEKPPASWFNWLFGRTYRVLKELQEKAALNTDLNALDQRQTNHENNKNNPHGVTKDQVGLGNVDNVQQIPMSQKGQPNGVATLDETGKVPSSQLPDIAAPVTSVNGKTGNVILTAADVGAETPAGAQSKVNAHATRTDNPHNVTKSQVGLGSVQNYGIASQAQAEAGSASNVYMTPQRTKQYVDTRLQNNVSFRINGGALQYYNGSGWNSLSALKSVQRGAANVTSVSPTDITISPVNVNKSFINVHVFGNLGGGQTRYITVSLVNSTTLRFTQSANASAQGPFEWEVIEFY